MTGRKRLVLCDWKPRKVAFLSDGHIPFESKSGVKAALRYLSDWKPDLLILGGDWLDCYLISSHDKDPGRRITLQDELDAAQPYWKKFDAIARRVIYLEGNHEHRLQRLIGANPGLFKLRALEFPRAAQLPSDWRFYPDQAHYKMGPIVALHGNLRGRSVNGEGKYVAAQMLAKMRVSCIFGHFHKFGKHYESSYDGTVRAGFANGHMCDLDAAAEYISVPDWQEGFSTIEFGRKWDCFEVRQHLIVGERFVADGKVYAG